MELMNRKNINTLKNKNGQVFIVSNVYSFCESNNLNYSNLLKVIKGKSKSCKGWTL